MDTGKRRRYTVTHTEGTYIFTGIRWRCSTARHKM